MRKLFVACLLALCAFASQAAGIGDYFGAIAGRFDSYGTGREGQEKLMDAVLIQVSEYMNKRMPEVIDQDTRLDRVSAEPGSHFSYHYTLLANDSIEDVRANFVSTVRPQLKNKVCESAQNRNFFVHGITVSYVYQGKDGAAIGGAEFAPDSCVGFKKTLVSP